MKKVNNKYRFRLLSVSLNSGEIIHDDFEDSEYSTEKLEIRARYLEPKEILVMGGIYRCIAQRLFNQRDCIIHKAGNYERTIQPQTHDTLKKAGVSPEYADAFELLFNYLKDYGNEQILLIYSAYQPFASKAYMLLIPIL